MDSTSVYRDDLANDCFWSLKGKHVGLAVDSLNGKYQYILITPDDYKKFNVGVESLKNMNVCPVCE